jgi:hypothetical protein
MFPPTTTWCLIIIFFLLFIFGSNNNNNNNKLGTILNNEASVLESFFQILSMAGKYFSAFSANSKIIN